MRATRRSAPGREARPRPRRQGRGQVEGPRSDTPGVTALKATGRAPRARGTAARRRDQPGWSGGEPHSRTQLDVPARPRRRGWPPKAGRRGSGAGKGVGASGVSRTYISGGGSRTSGGDPRRRPAHSDSGAAAAGGAGPETAHGTADGYTRGYLGARRPLLARLPKNLGHEGVCVCEDPRGWGWRRFPAAQGECRRQAGWRQRLLQTGHRWWAPLRGERKGGALCRTGGC